MRAESGRFGGHIKATAIEPFTIYGWTKFFRIVLAAVWGVGGQEAVAAEGMADVVGAPGAAAADR